MPKSHITKIALSFDDGALDGYTNIFPLLKKYNLPATFNIVSGYLDQNTCGVEKPFPTLTWEMVREMSMSSLIEIANHSSNLDGNLLISEFDVTELDNKNRVQFYYSLPNKSHSTFNDTTRRFKVYRAYAYICDANHTNIQISQTPVYFTIYDIGSIQSYAEASQTGGYKS